MDSLNLEAIAALRTTVENILPSTPSPTLLINHAQIKPTGIGGFIGINSDPQAELKGRSVTASILINVSAANASQLSTRYAEVVDALLSVGQGELRAQGILKLNLSEPAEQSDDMNTARDLQLDILFEFIKLPEEAEEVIETVPLTVELG